MEKSKFMSAAIVISLMTCAMGVFAQADSSNVPPLRGNPIVKLPLQERETPVVNNITNVTQNVTQQLISSGMDGAYTSTSGWNGGGAGTYAAQSYASCGGGKVVSGGGECTDFASSWTRLQSSFPSGNGWVAVCAAAADNGGAVYAQAFVVCVP
jgi:hypothetical protein